MDKSFFHGCKRMLKSLKKLFGKTENESYIYCPHCGRSYNSLTFRPFYSIENRDDKIFKCKDCGDFFWVLMKKYYEPSVCFIYQSFKLIPIEEKNLKDCIGQTYFDFYYPIF